ncbi:MAG: tryptophan-rich sensory protein [Chlorobiaceae bacterium]|nr:tryptophan-rich sensory protein [Chlorobiaceae bacterium]NTV61741.1 tryptophan-rich sensory protein [Chlorobiaceae bacterium]
MTTWYDELKKPPLTPPKKIFGTVWAVLYLFVTASLILYFLAPAKPRVAVTLVLLAIHFTAGFTWTTIFFKKKKIFPALLDIILIDSTLIALIVLFYGASPAAALLLVPYLCWGLFAGYLNWGIWRLNP